MGHQDNSTFLILAASSLPLVPIIISLLYMSGKPFLSSFSPLLLISDLLRSAYRFAIRVLASIHSYPDMKLKDMECSICLNQVEDGDEVTKLMCAHVFHKLCLDSWFALKITCPICCRQINSCCRMEKGEDGEERMIIIHLKLMQPRASRRTRDHGDNFWLR